MSELMNHGGQQKGVLWMKLRCLPVRDLILRDDESAMCTDRKTREVFALDQLNEVTAESLNRLNLQDFWEEVAIRVIGHEVNSPVQRSGVLKFGYKRKG
jgi:hypothetical protein